MHGAGKRRPSAAVRLGQAARAFLGDCLASPGDRLLLLLLCLVLVSLLLTACARNGRPTPAAALAATATPESESESLVRAAEARQLPLLPPDFASMVRSQPWFQGLTPQGATLLAAIVDCQKAAQARGESESVQAMLGFAAEQPWYGDGLDEGETVALTAVFQAYAQSLSDDRAPSIGPVLSTTLKYALFSSVDLPETGPLVVLVSAQDPALGRRALDLTAAALPRVEAMVGRYPYRFLHLELTGLPEIYAGLSYEQFIDIDTDYVDSSTITHELTHSTLYGIFPIWFEEGLAHFVENYVNGTLDAASREFQGQLRLLGGSQRLDIRHRGAYGLGDELAERAQGFLFINSAFQVLGRDGLAAAIRSLRTQSLDDQALIKALAAQGPPETRARLADLVCHQVIGTTHDYCLPQ